MDTLIYIVLVLTGMAAAFFIPLLFLRKKLENVLENNRKKRTKRLYYVNDGLQEIINEVAWDPKTINALGLNEFGHTYGSTSYIMNFSNKLGMNFWLDVQFTESNVYASVKLHTPCCDGTFEFSSTDKIEDIGTGKTVVFCPACGLVHPEISNDMSGFYNYDDEKPPLTELFELIEPLFSEWVNAFNPELEVLESFMHVEALFSDLVDLILLLEKYSAKYDEENHDPIGVASLEESMENYMNHITASAKAGW